MKWAGCLLHGRLVSLTRVIARDIEGVKLVTHIRPVVVGADGGI